MSSTFRPVRTRLAAVTAVVAVSALLFGACGGGGGGGGIGTITVTGPFGEAPSVTFPTPFEASSDQFEVVIAGNGAEITSGDRLTINYAVYGGLDGTQLESTFGAQPQRITVGNDTLLPILDDALIGERVGSRMLVTNDATEVNGQWIIYVIDVIDAGRTPTEASGTEVAPVAGLPTVTFENGIPVVTMPGGAPPAELVVQPLIIGNGPVIAAGQTLVVHYTGAIWASGTVFDSSWESAPAEFGIGVGQLIAGFDEGVVGQTVGSRLLIIIPPDKGYGEQGNPQAGIAGTDTLVFVVDILEAF